MMRLEKNKGSKQLKTISDIPFALEGEILIYMYRFFSVEETTMDVSFWKQNASLLKFLTLPSV